MTPSTSPAGHRPYAHHRTRGFTMLDLLISLLIVGVLATIATPSFTAPMHQARRADALVAVMDLQQAQERWWARHGRYATLAELGSADQSPQGHYRLELRDIGPQGYVVAAHAQGRQASDRDCREMRVRVRLGQADFAPVLEEGGADAAQRNRRCWRV
jgi:type IV pilus assembly protein PilE